ncbi:MAG: hypothetical protein KAS72_06925 [Phycisphaerales bacterium]|nr:hypothetical protein [Phycisphaerales bacterium]
MPDQDTNEVTTKKKSPMKTIVLVAALLLVEAVGIFIVLQMWGGPGPVQGGEQDLEREAENNRQVEMLVLQERMPNQSTGRIWLYDTEVYIILKSRHEDRATKEFERRGAEIKTGIAQIWRRAHHEDFREPNLEKLTSQVCEFLNGVLGLDEEGRPRIEKVLIPKCNAFRADY